MKKVTAFLLALVILICSCPLSFVGIAETNTSSKQNRYSILVLDRSNDAGFYSQGTHIYTASTSLPYVKTAATKFLTDISKASGNNHVAVIAYNDTATVIAGFDSSIDNAKKAVNQLTASSSTRNIAAGLEAADKLLDSITDKDAIKNVILVTTGMTNSGTHSYNGRYSSSTVGSGWYRMDTNIKLYAYANVAIEAATTVKKKSTLYVLGLFQSMLNIPQEGKNIAEFFRLTASDLATSLDTFIDVDDPENIEFAFGTIIDDILQESELLERKYKFAGMLSDETEDSEEICYYTDAYFLGDPKMINPSLASMSLALELSTWSSNEATDWYKRNAIEGTKNFDTDKLKNVKALLTGKIVEIGNTGRIDWDNKYYRCPNCDKGDKCDHWNGLGFSHFSANDDWEKVPTNDSIGVCAARKQIDNGKYTLVAIVVRGGGYGSEWASNFTIGTSGNHEGFDDASNKVVKWINSYLSDLGSNEPHNLKFWIVGYSRGAITANMVAGKIDDNPSIIKYGTITPDNLFCYAFEPPQGIVQSKNGGKYANIHNYVNITDLVPMVAPNVWSFTRYNRDEASTNVTFHNIMTTGTRKKFNVYESDMKKQLAEMGFGDFAYSRGKYKENGYNIKDDVIVSNFRFDKSKFLPFGDPLWWYEDVYISTSNIYQDGLTYLFNDLFESRMLYTNKLQTTVRSLTGILFHYDGIAAGAVAYVGNGIKTKFDIGHFFECVGKLFTYDNLVYIIKPMISLNPLYSFDARLRDVESNAEEVVSRVFADYSFIMQAAQFKIFINTLSEIIVSAFKDICADLWNNNTDDINTIAHLIAIIVDNKFQPHYPEVTLAWVRSLDPNYNDNVKDLSPNTTTRLIRINCPVDVKVVDGSKNLVASFINDKPNSEQEVIHYVNDKGEKILYLPGTENFSIIIDATGNGDLNITIEEYNFLYGRDTRLVNYYEIPIIKGDRVNCYIPAISYEEQLENNEFGSETNYRVVAGEHEIIPSEEFRGSDIPTKKHHVTLNIEGNGGYALGAGDFLQGYFAKVNAYPYGKGTFEGWFINGNLISTDLEYRFAVRNDTTIVAKFSNVAISKLSVVAGEGGSVTPINDYFFEGAELPIEATPADGYKFVGWTSSKDGVITDPMKLSTQFVMGRNSTEVMANFESLTTPPVPSTGDETPIEVYIVLLLISFVAIGVIIVMMKKRSCKE